MLCYCKSLSLDERRFVRFKEVSPMKDDEHDYCKTNMRLYDIKNSFNFFLEMSVVLSNGLFAIIFRKLVEYQKQYTLVDDTKISFSMIFIMEFSNLALIILLLSFDPGFSDLIRDVDDDALKE
jgi:hypothetical protein